MTEEQRAALEAPFRPQDIKQRDSGYGKKLSYLEGHSVIARLNQAFDGDWNFEIINHIVDRDSDQVIVQARITAGSTIKESYGSAKIKHQRDTGDIVDLGRDMKAATTDAVKKTATLLGVGLYLYGDSGLNPQHGSSSEQSHGMSTPHHMQQRNQLQPYDSSHPVNNHENGAGRTNRLSQKQHAYALKLASGSGLSKGDLNQYCQQVFGVMLDFISRKDASVLIESLRHNRVQSQAA